MKHELLSLQQIDPASLNDLILLDICSIKSLKEQNANALYKRLAAISPKTSPKRIHHFKALIDEAKAYKQTQTNTLTFVFEKAMGRGYDS